MKLGYALLANYAEQMPDGRFSAINAGIDGFLVDELPVRIDQKMIVSHFDFSSDQCDRQYSFGLSLTNPDGQEFVFEGASRLTPLKDEYFPERPGGINVIFPIYSWEIKAEGIYKVNFYVDKEYAGSLSIGIALKRPSPDPGV